MKRMFVAIVTVAFASLAHADDAPMVHHHKHPADRAAVFGVPGNPAKPSRSIAISMVESDGNMLFEPSQVEVKLGEQVKFNLLNTGKLDHEFVVGTVESNLEHAREMQSMPEMVHQDPNALRLAPGKSGSLIWRFTKAGKFDFSCLIPGHREAGMSGTIVVKPVL